MKRRALFVSILFLTLAIQGCGPGFPIMTGEQEQLITDVDRLRKDNESFKNRLAKLEGPGGIPAIREELDVLKRSLADANLGLDKLRNELSVVNGNIEEGAHDREKMMDALGAAGEDSAALNQKLASIESSVRSVQDRLASFEASFRNNDKTYAEVMETVAALDRKATQLEKALTEAREPAPKANDEKQTRPGEAETLYQKGYKETASKEYPKAVETFQKFLSSYPEHKYAGNAQYWLGEIYYAKGDWEMAILEFDKAVKKYPESEKIPASLLKQGFAFEKIGAKKEARVLLRDVVKKYPNTTEADLAKKRLDALR
ncbi:MAG: tol-pal system protein YbgF [Deltaproteobacteria bacterium GWC2_55_46]|nr:MAG: tol-pal system protein YbgF [Deltaproteobacteria bacterium GWA2_55_82]OIJ74527.1 MAG: tol-pal system protein YbgF [Deltaproteobacteria bacterium GWC2_55_46]